MLVNSPQILSDTGSKPTKLWAKGPKFLGYKKRKTLWDEPHHHQTTKQLLEIV